MTDPVVVGRGRLLTDRPCSVGVVVVHYSAADDLRLCLAALAEQTVAPRDVVVVDNGAGDECGDVAAFFRARVHPMGANVGYAAAANAGISQVIDGCEAVLVLTHDCVLRADSIELLSTDLASDEQIGSVGPLIADSRNPDRTWSAGGSFGRRTGRPFHLEAGRPVAEVEGSRLADVEWLDGSCLMMRCEAAAEAGPLDESWFLYVEELEWLQRMKGRGWRVVCDRRALAWQRPGGTPPYLEARNLLRWFLRTRQAVPTAVFVVAQLARCGCAVLAGRTWEASARLLGLRDGVGGGLSRRYLTRRR